MVHSNGVSPFITPRMSPLLALQAQVDFTGLAPHGRPLPHTWWMPIGALAGIAVRDVARLESYPLVIPQALLPMELLLAAETLQATALITLKDRLISPAAGVTFLAHQPRIQALLWWASLGTHTRISKEITYNVTVTGLSPGVKTKALSLKPAQNFHRVLHTFKKISSGSYKNSSHAHCISSRKLIWFDGFILCFMVLLFDGFILCKVQAKLWSNEPERISYGYLREIRWVQWGGLIGWASGHKGLVVTESGQLCSIIQPQVDISGDT